MPIITLPDGSKLKLIYFVVGFVFITFIVWIYNVFPSKISDNSTTTSQINKKLPTADEFFKDVKFPEPKSNLPTADEFFKDVKQPDLKKFSNHELETKLAQPSQKPLTQGEIAGALGSFIGGIVGAGGAILAVYLSMKQQRDEEVKRVSEAVRIELMTATKYVNAAIEIFIKIKNGKEVPLKDAGNIAPLFDSVIYPAVADKIGLLTHPYQTIGFYMRIAEAKFSLNMLCKATNTSEKQIIMPENVAAVVNILVTALQLAQPIITNSKNDFDDAQVQDEIISQINKSLSSAEKEFPSCNAFKYTTNPN